MKYTLIIPHLFIIAFIISNVPPVNHLVHHDDLRYSNATGSFTFEEYNLQGRDLEMCLHKFQVFKQDNRKDTILYRVTSMNPFHFWNFSEYLCSNRYKLPFMNWHLIDSVRGAITSRTGFQDF